MQLRSATILLSLGTLAHAGVPPSFLALWPQIGLTPPGTNQTVRPDVVQPSVTPTTAAGTVIAVPSGVQPAVPVSNGPAPPPPPQPAPNFVREAMPGSLAPASSPGSTSPNTSVLGAIRASISSVDPLTCKVSISESRVEVVAAGGILDVNAQFVPAGCQPAAVSSTATWLQGASASPTPNVLRFSAAPNTTGRVRTAAIVVADHQISFEQPALSVARVAAIPGRLFMSMRKDKDPATRKLTIVGESNYSISPTQPWLTVTSLNSETSSKIRSYRVNVNRNQLQSGRNEGFIVLKTDADSLPLVVPVVVERTLVR